MKKNLFLTFCFSLIPGAGQMYQEYMKRGVSLLIITALCGGMGVVLNLSIFLIPIPIIIIYSFFDSFRLRNLVIRGEERQKDTYIWQGISEDQNNVIERIFKKKNIFLGIILIIVGIYFFLDSFLLKVLYETNVSRQIIRAIYSAVRYIPTLLVSVIAVGIGIKLMINKK